MPPAARARKLPYPVRGAYAPRYDYSAPTGLDEDTASTPHSSIMASLPGLSKTGAIP